MNVKGLLAVSAVASLLVACAPDADDAGTGIELPRQVSWTAYADQALVHDQVAAIGQALEDSMGVELRLQPADSDRARAELLRQGKVDFSATAVGGSVAAQEGVFDFSGADWGPQKVRLVLEDNGEPIDYALAVAGDLGIETYGELRDKRVAWYADAPVVNVNTEAYLAYGGLTWSDVERVDVHGFFDEAMKALEEGRVDAAFAPTSIDAAYEAAAGPRGLFWPSLDPENVDGWERMEAVAPYFVRYDVTDGAAVDHAAGLHGAHYPYPILVALDTTDTGLVYNMTKALVELFPRYQGKAPGIDGWKLDAQELQWFVPYHEGAVAYLKEAGVWSDEAQAHNDRLIARQEALAAAWEALKAENPADWQSAWAERRRQALEEGGFQVIF